MTMPGAEPSEPDEDREDDEREPGPDEGPEHERDSHPRMGIMIVIAHPKRDEKRKEKRKEQREHRR